MADKNIKKILTLFGTRPEAIKLAPIIWSLEAQSSRFKAINVASSQHTDLLHPFLRLFDIRVDHDLDVMADNQTPVQVCSKVLSTFDKFISKVKPDCVLVQGDTTTALAGALTAFHHHIPVGHVEAGLRSGHMDSPFPEEMNRRVITQLATYHFAATAHNQKTLLAEGVSDDAIFVTGNPVVDSLKWATDKFDPSNDLKQVFESLSRYRIIVLTTHRRESFGEKMAGNLKVLREFVESNEDIALIFPVHLNPAVQTKADTILTNHPRIKLLEPLIYTDFINMLSKAWLIVSDSGGVQEEAPTLGKPLLVIRDNTERPEAIEVGVARLVDQGPEQLKKILADVNKDGAWLDHVSSTPNPFGDGSAGEQIVSCLRKIFS